jgi:hypothetical protein
MHEKFFINEWFLEKVKSSCDYRLSPYNPVGESLLSEGIPCKVLEPGQFWKTGYLQVKVEFVPDELLQVQSEQ